MSQSQGDYVRMIEDNKTIDRLTEERDELKTALRLILDNVDYLNGACGLTEMVGACLPSEVLRRAHKSLGLPDA